VRVTGQESSTTQRVRHRVTFPAEAAVEPAQVSRTIAELCNEGIAAILDGDHEAALAAFTAVLQQEPTHRTARANLERLNTLRVKSGR